MKVLFIACYSPLINNSASIETLQYLNNLAKVYENEIHLLTVNFPKNSVYYDEYIYGMLDKRVKVHIISGGKIFEKIMPRKSEDMDKKTNICNELNGNSKLNTSSELTKNKNKKLNINKILKKVKNIVAVPDMYYMWAKKASKYGIELMEKEKFDVIFSMHEPPSSHICAMAIKKKFKDIPWVTYWSDPWLKDSTRENSNALRKSFEGKLEKKVVELSDRFIFVTKANRDDYVKTYNISMDDTFIITRGYDEAEYKTIKEEAKPEKLNKEKVNFVYAGEIFAKLRDVRPFIKALDNIKLKDNDTFNKLNVLFFGNIDDNEVRSDLLEVENVQVSPRIPYKDALGYMLLGEVLLLFGNKNSKQIPAKIYDYFGAEGIIFIILGDENDPILDVVRNKEKCIVVNNNPKEIEDGIYKILNLLESNKSLGPVEEYKWEYIASKLNKVLEG